MTPLELVRRRARFVGLLSSQCKLRGLATCFVATFSSTVFVGLENGDGLLWFANGILLSYLLLVPRWRWRLYLACGFLAMLAGGIVIHPQRWSHDLVHSFLNTAEVLIAASLLRKRSAQLPRYADQRYLLRFAESAVAFAPAVTGLLFALIYSPWKHVSFWHSFSTWLICDGLGIAVVTPACVVLIQTGLTLPGGWRSHWFSFIALFATTYLSFCQTRIPLVFLIYPGTALVLFRMGLSWATLNTLLIAGVGGWFTVHGEGPFAKAGTLSTFGPSVLLQLFLASGTFMMYLASSMMDTLRATERQLRQIAYLHELVTENSRDVIILADFDGHRSYVSASASHMGGWQRSELLDTTSLDLVHLDDRPKAEEIVKGLRMGGEGGLLECRVLNKNGAYVWVEANLRPVRDPSTGVVIGILNIVRDISERKRAERELKDAYAALEQLAVTDPLTRLANRRAFDQCMAGEWRRGMREHAPLSLLLIDADWFKSYNDTYGHPRGDSCLKQIAEAALDVVTRPRDLVARIGGEEFAIILPNTPPHGALEVGNHICEALRLRRLPHNTNPTGQVTVSIGCATIVPSLGQHVGVLMQRADKALYAAKHAGRNQVRSSEDQATEDVALEAS